MTVLLVTETEPSGFKGRAAYDRILDTKHLYEKRSAYEMFNVTSAVNFWMRNPSMERQEHSLQVRIESVFSGVGNQGSMDIVTSPYVETEPLLLVFSSSSNKLTSVSAEEDPNAFVAHLRRRRSLEQEEEEEESNIISTATNTEKIGKSRKNQKRHRNPCRRRPLFVNFSEINYDTWIIAPRGYEVRT